MKKFFNKQQMSAINYGIVSFMLALGLCTIIEPISSIPVILATYTSAILVVVMIMAKFKINIEIMHKGKVWAFFYLAFPLLLFNVVLAFCNRGQSIKIAIFSFITICFSSIAAAIAVKKYSKEKHTN